MKKFFANLNPMNWLPENINTKVNQNATAMDSNTYMIGSGGEKYPHGLSNAGYSHLINNKKVRQNARAAFHDTPEAKGLVSRFADSVVDTGLKLECTPMANILGLTNEEAEAWARDTEQRFDLWAKSKKSDRRGLSNFYQTQRLYHISQQRDNDLFVRFYYSKKANLPNPLQISMLDPNQIKGDSNTSTYSYSSLNDGINRNEQGEELSYNIYTRSNKDGSYKSVTVPRVGKVSKKIMMIHGFSAEYAGQNRGYSRLEHILQEFQDLTDFKISNVKKAIAQSQITMFVKPAKDNDSSDPFEGITRPSGPIQESSELTDADKVILEDLGCPVSFSYLPEATVNVPGSTSVFNLKKGEDLKPFQTQAAAESYTEFIDNYMEYNSSSISMPNEVLKMKFGENYSASRGALLLFWRVVLIWRGEMEVDFLNPTYESWLSGEIAAGRISAPGFSDPILKQAWLDCRWIGAPMPNIDPQRTAKAEMLYVEMGATNLDRVARDYNGSDGAANRRKLVEQFKELPWAKWTLKPSDLEGNAGTEIEED